MLRPYTNQIITRLQKGENLEQLAQDISIAARVTPNQVVLYVVALVEAAKRQG
jgi:hypothetical protein